jgi:hypothetical protein
MQFRTVVNIETSPAKITYADPVLFIGSCFASSIGAKMEEGRMRVLVNPAGTVYNPVSVTNTLEMVTGGRKYSIDDLYNHERLWLSFNHYMSFSSQDPEAVLAGINENADAAREFISSAKFLFVTFGTARVYRWNETGKIVSNCHKIPSSRFTHELLEVKDIVELWILWLDKLESLFPKLRIIFTISPVRHWKDGAHGNQVSKSILFLAVEELLKHPSRPGYFPAYEIFMDDLRDYRFYDEDMLHPSQTSIDYIWKAFTDCYFERKTLDLWKDVSKITRALSHRIQSGTGKETKKFAENMLSKIDSVSSKIPTIDLNKGREYFTELLKDQ